MQFRTIGDLTVSVVGLGCNQFGTAFCDEADSIHVINEAIEAGITYFDTADEYGANYADRGDPVGWGRSEEILGRVVTARRDQVVIGSKFGVKPNGMEGGGGSRKWAQAALDASLRRLGTDYVDLYQLHFPDPLVPVEETLGVMNEMVREGKVREIGCSNFTAAGLEEAHGAAKQAGIRPFAVSQTRLNLFSRTALDDIMPVCERLGMAFIPYYPLASGMLTGKYRRGQALPRSARLIDQVGDDARGKVFSERAFDRIEALSAFAAERGHTLLELAFGWLLGHPNVATVIAGAARQGQARANAAACHWHLTAEEVSEATLVAQKAGG